MLSFGAPWFRQTATNTNYAVESLSMRLFS